MSVAQPESRVLSAPLKVSFPYTRSLGAVMTDFMTGLRDGRILGARLSDGRVAVPPVEYDPATHAPVTTLVEVGLQGTVQTWSWVSRPVPEQPLDHPFAFALILLDGADTPVLHAVDAGSAAAMSTGMRVQVRWKPERVGHITDIACFEPAPADGEVGEPGAPQSGTEHPVSGGMAYNAQPTEDDPRVTGVITPVNLDYIYEASPEESAFFRGLAEGKIRGQRCPVCHKVYVPPRGACPVDGVPTTDEVELSHTGTVTTFCVVNVPFLGQKIEPPYVSAYILLDGADIALQHLIQGLPADEVRMGMRVTAKWKPESEWGTTIENIEYFEPADEPDAPFESYAAHL